MPQMRPWVDTARRVLQRGSSSIDSVDARSVTSHRLSNHLIHDGRYKLNRYNLSIPSRSLAQDRCFPQPLPFTRLEIPTLTTKTWDLPALVWKNVKQYYAQDESAKFLHHGISLAENLGLSHGEFYINFKFNRVARDKFQVIQKSTYKYFNRRAKSNFKFHFTSEWVLPGSSKPDFTPADIDHITSNLAAHEVDFVTPSFGSVTSTLQTLADCTTIQPDVLENLALHVLDEYQAYSSRLKIDEITADVFESETDNINTRVQLSEKIPSSALGTAFQKLPASHRAIIALGSNLDDRIQNIEQALQQMRQKGLDIKSISHLYETKAMYYEDQADFLNAACEVETDLEPLALLDVLQGIETDLGRVRNIDKGPRTLDLDVLLYDFDVFNHERLQIPHKLMLERQFVLRPLADFIPEERLPPPYGKRSIVRCLNILEVSDPNDRPLMVSQLSKNLSLATINDPARGTHVMAILNITPDSFSDGGKHSNAELDTITSIVRKFIEDGATIIDVGGQSTRPNATLVSWEEELDRVRPVIHHIRSMPEASNIAISIDTFYSEVVRGAIMAGADIINDVSGGTLDPQILPLTAELQKPIILMHMRGTPQTMHKLTDYPDGVIRGVEEELMERVSAAKKAGVLPWKIILDPGIGFAKTQAQNLDLLRNFHLLRNSSSLRNFPWLVGTSRKGFIGKITGVPKADERGWGTAATVTASIAGGADIVRVHDVSEMVQVVRMADAMYRPTLATEK